jgi:hypothetical protein
MCLIFSWLSLDQLHAYDELAFSICKIRIHIYSKCGVEVDFDQIQAVLVAPLFTEY